MNPTEFFKNISPYRHQQRKFLASLPLLLCFGVTNGAVTVTNLTNTTYDGVVPNKIVQSGTSYRGGFINSDLFVEGSVGSGSGQFRDVFRLQGPP